MVLTCRGCGSHFTRRKRVGPIPKLCGVCRPKGRRAARQRWVERNPEAHQAAQAKYRAANREACNARVADWYGKNRERKSALEQAWRSRNRDRVRESNRAAKKRNYDSDRKRAEHLKYKYGLSLGDEQRMLVTQGGGCAICGRECPSGKRLAVDHDHTSGVVRGLLCTSCNVGLGSFRDNPELLSTAIDYLMKVRVLAA